ncbi:hypothetical protein AAFF_G00427860 [Aldrovandia affinis]|uniref:Uncharacterized protein n=1 Tax=Aldrovandia affinis TaxID=143900 RepID=A0AAD7VXT1_9TELE|nr:hypothetical protein AAFF_G00427860 [Aldrovandia affinis]
MAVENYRQITEVFADGIVAPLTDGLCAILSVTDIINKINSTSVQAPDRKKILDLIATANCKTEQATKASHENVEKLNGDMLKLIVSKKDLEDQMKSKEEVLQQKERQIDSLEMKNKVLTRDLKEAKSQLEEAIAKQAQAQADYDRADEAASVTLALMLIPIAGTIAGGISYVWCRSQRCQVEKRRNEWEKLAAGHEEDISDCKEKLSTLKRERKNISKEISKMKQDLIRLDEKQREKKSLLKMGL